MTCRFRYFLLIISIYVPELEINAGPVLRFLYWSSAFKIKMGCITGMITKTFLVAFNILVAIAGVIVLTLASVIQTTLNGYGHDIPQEPLDVLIGLQSASTFIICLSALGVVVSCCCGNKLFLYTYFVLGLALVGITLVFAGMGAANINNEKYADDIKVKMDNDVQNYNLDSPGEFENQVDIIYKNNQCCGSMNCYDYPDGKRPAGCCREFTGTTCTSKNTNDLYITGCYEKLLADVADKAVATIHFSIFFGVLVFALLTSTCLCVKCTDAMPI
ncbi:CD63 antigen [Hyalella azteca]|uniref:CD63 antigen n=1 Tax=Hyalella azteca TaxID=294128 RepID=A0A8B7PKU8_HYAAZ|nr:CD63 antigen [Hyalella azteca]